MVELPVDILLGIIEEIGMQERPNFDLLWAFCSTCRTLRPHAQTFLFRSLSLNFKENPMPCSFGPAVAIYWKHMEFIVNENPQVAACVKYLRFRVPSSADISPEFVSLLSKLTKLTTLRCGYDDGRSASWTSLYAQQKRQWEAVFQLPSIHRLQILGLADIPISVLYPCTHLEALYIDRFSTFDAPELDNEGSLSDVSQYYLPLLNLTSVQTAWDIKSLDPLFTIYPSIGAPLVEKSSVKDMFVKRIWDSDCTEFREFPSLRSFGVDTSRLMEPGSLFTNFHPSSLQSLDWLGLEIRWDWDIPTEYPSRVLGAALDIQLGFPSLNVVVITVAFLGEELSAFKDGMKEELGELDQLFASTINFPRLNTVTIMLKAYTQSVMEEGTKFWVEDSDNIKKYLPLFAARFGCTLVSLVCLRK